MSETAQRLLATFDTLLVQEQHEILTTLLRRSGELPATLVSDEHLLVLPDQLFQALDQEEANGDQGDSQ